MGISKTRVLILPRLLGCIIATICLTIYFDLVAILGGYIISRIQLTTPFNLYMHKIISSLEFSDISISTPSNNPDYGTFSVIIECTGDAGIASEIIGDSSASTSILLLGLPYDNKVIDLEEIVSFDKKIIGSVGSDGADFKAAMNISKEINMDHFNTTTFDFNDWSKAWDLHKTNQKLKVKLKIGHKALYK